VRGLAGAVAVVGVVSVVAFAPATLLDSALASGVLGVGLGVALVALWRPSGLLAAWRYLRELA